MNKPRKLALAVLASITIAGIAGASASSLGGLNSASLGSDDTITASCQTSTAGIGVSYATTFDATDGGNNVVSVTFSGVDAPCNGKTAQLTLATVPGTSTAQTVLGTYTATVNLGGGSSFTVPVSPGLDAELVEALSLVIQG